MEKRRAMLYIECWAIVILGLSQGATPRILGKQTVTCNRSNTKISEGAGAALRALA